MYFLLAPVLGSSQSIYYNILQIGGPQAGCFTLTYCHLMACLPWLVFDAGLGRMSLRGRVLLLHSVPLSLRAARFLPGTSVICCLCASILVCYCHHCPDVQVSPCATAWLGKMEGMESSGCKADLHTMFKIKSIRIYLPLNIPHHRHSQWQSGAS